MPSELDMLERKRYEYDTQFAKCCYKSTDGTVIIQPIAPALVQVTLWVGSSYVSVSREQYEFIIEGLRKVFAPLGPSNNSITVNADKD